MLPWHTKRILVIVYTLRGTVFPSIAHFRFQVESYLQMSGGRDLPRQRYFAPPEPAHRLDVPQLVLERQLRFQDDHVLRPADRHGLVQHLRGRGVDTVKVPHPPQISGREAGTVGIGVVQEFRSRHRRALLRPTAYQAANLAVQLHLGQLRRHQRIQRREQGAVVGGFPDVHRLLLSGAAHLFLRPAEKNAGTQSRAFPCRPIRLAARYPRTAECASCRLPGWRGSAQTASS